MGDDAPKWFQTLWAKATGAVITVLVSSLISAFAAAYHFVGETNVRLAVLENDMKRAMSELDARLEVNSKRGQKHEFQIVELQKEQKEQATGINAKEVPASPPPTSKPPQ
jgi:uncharacterized protein (DUF3084 family)